jgi:hypothetical protein
MSDYDVVRKAYKPDHIRYLLIAESQPPAASVDSSRQFYRTERAYPEDRLFVNTVRALYPKTLDTSPSELAAHKETWLRKLQQDGFYMIEALETSLAHEVTKEQRQERIRKALPRLIERVKGLAEPQTKIILIKSNVFDVAATPLKEAGFTVLNTELVDYPGRFNQRSYREKLAKLVASTSTT